MKKSLNIAVLTVSDSRTFETDKSGRLLKDSAQQDGHHVVAHEIVTDEIIHIRQQVTDWVDDNQVQVVLITGGTGFAPRDVTPEAVEPLFDRVIPGFGELFRVISYDEIGTATIQSRAVAGVSNQTLIFAMPGSTGACHTAWNKILKEQLDNTFIPCNFVQILSI
jgi:molybdenum cofactor biosynthesis protein B